MMKRGRLCLVAVEKKRGCGYRKVGGIYLAGDWSPSPCDRLPLAIKACPYCGEHPRFTRSMAGIAPAALWGRHPNTEECVDPPECQACYPSLREFLMWVGSDYTVESFRKEAQEMRVSKRIPTIPKDFKVGHSWVYLAKKRLIPTDDADWLPGMEEEKRGYGPGVFMVWRPARIEKIVTDLTPEEELKALVEQGITPVVVPHDDPDHAARKGKGQETDEPTEQ